MIKKDQKDNKKEVARLRHPSGDFGEVKKDMTFTEVLQMYPQSGEIMQQMGMHCVGCVAASGETLEQGCQVHGIDVEELVKKINDKMSNGK